MAVSLPLGSTSLAYASRTNSTLTAPASIANGDVLFAVIGLGAASPPTPTAPTGWTLLTGFPTTRTQLSFSVTDRMYWKLAASESGNYTWTHASCNSWGFICRFTGAHATAPFTPNITTNNGVDTVTTALSITTAADSSCVLFVDCNWGDTANNLSVPTGSTPTFTEFYDAGIGYVAAGVLTTAGATGNKTHTNNNTASSASPWYGYLVALQPPAAGAAFIAPRPYIVRQAVNRAANW